MFNLFNLYNVDGVYMCVHVSRGTINLYVQMYMGVCAARP